MPKQQSFTILGTMAGLNEYVNAERSNRYKAAAMKKSIESAIGWHIRRHKLKPVKAPVRLHIFWYCPNAKKDKDNIAFSKKFIFDSLVSNGILKNDGWKHLVDNDPWRESFRIDKSNPRVVVVIEEDE